MKSILIYSGGLDSTTALYQLLNTGDEVKCLGIDYGQRHRKELTYAANICHKLGVEFKIADLRDVGYMFLAGSSQTSPEIAVPQGHYEAESMKQTVVPNRNMIMLSVAIGWAVSLKYDRVVYAAHGGDHAIYPDCRPEFADLIDRAARICDWHPIYLERPFIHMSKAAIAQYAKEMGVPIEDTWSCYEGRELHCGKCGTCVERIEAIKEAGFEDPTRYEEA